VPSTTTTTEPVQELVQVDPEVTALLGAISMLPQSEIAAAVDNIIEAGVSADEAAALATNPEVLQSVTAEQAAEIFDAVEVSELSDAQAEQLVEAVQGATEEVRAEFEDKINVFGGKFNKYVPVGSNINVGQRKVLVAATGILFMAPAVSVSSSTSGSSSSDSRRKQ
jgi:prophage DNA circulation protein